MTFTGFPDAGISFLADLAENNDKEWFTANKETFQTQLQKPAQAFIVALGERLQSISPNIRYDTRLNGSGSLMRIYRDVRFSKDKTPYKTQISMVFWEGVGKKTAHPGFYLRFEPSGGSIMVGQHGFDKPLLEAYRQAILDDDTGNELADILSTIEADGTFNIGGREYKKVPRGFDKEHPRADLLRHKGVYASNWNVITPAQVTSPELVDICYEYAKQLAPLQRWLVQLEQKST